MGIYSGPELIKIINRTKAMKPGEVPVLPLIDIHPFDEALVGPNSIDVHLGTKLLVYCLPNVMEKYPEIIKRNVTTGSIETPINDFIHSVMDNPTAELNIPKNGMMLWPGILYLGTMPERTITAGCVPWLDGRSSTGRLGMQVHLTAGRGDDGFGTKIPGGCSWTFEITTIHPLWIAPGLRVGQLTYFELIGERMPYSGRYSEQVEPTASKMHMDPPKAKEDDK